jgi:CO/xanthine dehydrogenase Mo-binding subunit
MTGADEQETMVSSKKANAVGSIDTITGKACYTADIKLPGTLVGKLLYSKYPHARVTRLDISRAQSLPSVVAVLTHHDIPGENSYLYVYDDQPLLVSDVVRYQGDILAVVAAEDEDAALAALDLIAVEYQVLPVVFDPIAAMHPDSPRVWPEKDNLVVHTVNEQGDIKAGFDQADIIIENTYLTQRAEHAFLETESALAYIDENGTLVVYSSTQAPHNDRKQIARALALPENQVRVIVPYVGGAFGGKMEAHVQIHAALLAYKTGRPVRIQRSREESILTHVKRHPMVIHYRTGATKDGLLTAAQLEIITDTGPYINAGEEVLSASIALGIGPYNVPNTRSEGYLVLTNNPICGAMRGFGLPQVNFAYEQQMDELAYTLQIDPGEIRLRNGMMSGSRLPAGPVVMDGRAMKVCVNEAMRVSGWNEREIIGRQPGEKLRRGWGMACSLYSTGYGAGVPDSASASLDMSADGSVLLRTGASDMGQGIHTVLSQITADSLGVDLSSIKLVRPDTHITSDAGPSVASRATYMSGNAVISAAKPIRNSLLEVATQITGLDKNILSLHDGHLWAEGEQLPFNVASLAEKALEKGLQMHAEGFYTTRMVADYSDSNIPDNTEPFTFAAHVAQVMVDVETGIIQVEKYYAVHDPGRLINTESGKGQIAGGVIQGLGYTLIEDLIVDHGSIQNQSLESYLIPTSKDIPEMKIGVVEFPYEYGPLGAKGLGEIPTGPVSATIANAVADAIGARIRQLPITPERVLEALDGLK